MIIGRRAWNLVTLRLCLTNLLVCGFTGCVFWQLFTLDDLCGNPKLSHHKTSRLKLACVVRVDRPHSMPECSWRLTYLLTYSMVQSPSWEYNWFAASQEIPRISRNPNVHYRTHKRPPPVYILGQPSSVHITTSHLLQIHPNIIHPSTPRSPQWSLSLRFPH